MPQPRVPNKRVAELAADHAVGVVGGVGAVGTYTVRAWLHHQPEAVARVVLQEEADGDNRIAAPPRVHPTCIRGECAVELVAMPW